MKKLISTLLVLVSLCPVGLQAQQPANPRRSQFASGPRPSSDSAGSYHLLDAKTAARQSNAVAFDRVKQGAFERVVVRGKLRALKPGLGGGLALLSTEAYGVTGPAPYVQEWAAPNLKKTLAVGIDLHNPPNREAFGPLGNYRGMPQREVSLHWAGRELVKRLAREEFRDETVDILLEVRHVVGGAEVTVALGEQKVYDAYFIPGLHPYESRLAVGADAAQAGAGFDVQGLRMEYGAPAGPRRPPVRVQAFNHVLTNNKKTAYQAEVDLPPVGWAFGRVIMTIELHDAGKDWDEWDRCGEVFVWDKQGVKRGIVPFITSYRTECSWRVDVTQFRPWLAGRTKIEIAAGTTFYKNRGYMMSVQLAFYHGTPQLEPYKVVPLWSGTARHGAAENHFRDFYAVRKLESDEQTSAARFWMTTTGHSQVGEFTPATRTLVCSSSGGESGKQVRRFQNTLWRDDCYLNPNRPQYGTWKYSRAGWAPGDVVRPWSVDLTPFLRSGASAELRYEPAPYDFSGHQNKPKPSDVAAAQHRVRSYVVFYREPKQLRAAPTLRISSVSAKSNAATAGLKRGDWLASYDGTRIDSVDDLRGALREAMKAGKKQVQVVIYRGVDRLELRINTGRMGVSLGR